MPILEVLMPTEVKVSLGGNEYVVRKMSLRQGFRLIKFINGLRASIVELFKEKAEISDGSATQDISIIFETLLFSGNLGELLAILLNVDDEKMGTAENLPIVELSDFIAAFVSVNDIERVIGNFKMAAEKLTPMINANLTPRSPSPSQESARPSDTVLTK